MGSSCFGAFVGDRAVSGKVPGVGAGGDACALKHLFRNKGVEEESPSSVLPPTAWNCSTALSVHQPCRGSQNTLEFANLIMFCKIQLSDEESSVSLSQQGTGLNIQEKSQGRKVFTPALYTFKVFYGSVGACDGICWLSWPLSALLGTLMELWDVCWGPGVLSIRICWNTNLIRGGARGCEWYIWLWSDSAWPGCPQTATGSVWWMLALVCMAGTWHLPWPCRAENLCKRCHWIRVEAGGLSATYTEEMPPLFCSFFHQ